MPKSAAVSAGEVAAMMDTSCGINIQGVKSAVPKTNGAPSWSNQSM